MSIASERKIVARRDFVAGSTAAILAGVSFVISGCASEYRYHFDDDRDGVDGVVSQNHGHRAVISVTQLETGEEVTLNIRGTSDHSHIVELSADDIQAIANGDPVEKTSTRNARHIHTVTFNA